MRAGLADSLAKLRVPTRDRIVDALIRAGELETALADAGCDEARVAADITQTVAGALVGCPPPDLHSLAAIAEQMRVPESVELSAGEGFAYYALHPLAYAELVDHTPTLATPAHPRAAVIGIRSIGSTLSAVVTAALAKHNVRADRITVRPTGHPYDRKTQFTPAQLRWIAAARHQRAEFLVVDEGPGLSGSSFLSVGDALLSAGVERRRVRFLCSWEPNPDALNAPGAGERWRGFQTCAARGHRPSADGLVDMGAGKWRDVFSHRVPHPDRSWNGGENAVSSWTQMERAKFLSSDGRRLFKFMGLGRFGEEVGKRAATLAASGFGPKYFGIHDGYAEYEMLAGRPARRDDLSRAMIERIADYCALRAAEFGVRGTGESSVDAMARYNYEQEFGTTAPFEQLPHNGHPVICDGRMQPYEWIVGADGNAYKTDGDTHGDDHFFPGPTDIAWDLAGAIVEWEMDAHAETALLERFTALTGDRVVRRIGPYVLAYAAFRSSYCRMAAHAMRGTDEYLGLVMTADRYHTIAALRAPRIPAKTLLDFREPSSALRSGD